MEKTVVVRTVLPVLPLMILATVVLTALKLSGKLAIPWWLVFAPLYGGFAFWLVVVLALVVVGFVVLVLAVIAQKVSDFADRHRLRRARAGSELLAARLRR